MTDYEVGLLGDTSALAAANDGITLEPVFYPPKQTVLRLSGLRQDFIRKHEPHHLLEQQQMAVQYVFR